MAPRQDRDRERERGREGERERGPPFVYLDHPLIIIIIGVDFGSDLPTSFPYTRPRTSAMLLRM
jgi:hypothetical protein